MIITCPNCGTQYSVDRVAFGQTAKTVRCFSCSHQWLQQPVVTPRVVPPHQPIVPQYQHMPPPTPSAYPGYPPPPGYPPSGYPPPPGYPPAEAAYGAAPPTPSPELIPEPAPEPDIPEDDDMPELTAGIDALFESDEDDVEEALEMIEEIDLDAPEPDVHAEIPGEITPPEDPDLSQDDLDSLFDEDEAGEGLDSVVESSGEDGEPVDIADIEDIPDPEPLPESLTADIGGDDADDDQDEAPASRRGRKKKPKKAKKKGRGGLIAVLVVVLLLGGLGAGMLFLRDLVLQYVPAMGMVYEMVGLSAPLGEGLEIRNVNSERGSSEGIDFLMLNGNIANVTEEPRPVPLIKALLFSAEGDVIQSVIQEPGRVEIPAGEVLGFSVKIDEPSPLARRLEVTFEARPDSE